MKQDWLVIRCVGVKGGEREREIEREKEGEKGRLRSCCCLSSCLYLEEPIVYMGNSTLSTHIH